jgi:hypothetical protein
MLLTCSNESQAVLGRLFFSPSAATLCRGTPDPPLVFPGRPAGRPRPQPGPAPGPVLLGDVPGFFRSFGTGRCGPGRARPGLRPGRGPGLPRPRSRLALRGFRRLAGGAAAGLSEFGTPGSARTILTRSGHSVAVSAWCWCVCCLDDLARASRSRPGGGVLCLDAVARLAGSLVAPRGFGCAGLRPFSLLRAVRWPGWSPGRRLHHRPEPLGVIELTLPVALVPCLSLLRSAPEAPAGRWSGGPLPSRSGSLTPRASPGRGGARPAPVRAAVEPAQRRSWPWWSPLTVTPP